MNRLRKIVATMAAIVGGLAAVSVALATDETELVKVAEVRTPVILNLKVRKGQMGIRVESDRPEIFVIHETAASLQQTLRLFKWRNYWSSYHALIDRAGRIFLAVPRSKTAFAAGRSRFNSEISMRSRHEPDFEPWTIPFSSDRDEAILNQNGVPSVNQFSYQVELVSPLDGYWCEESPDSEDPMDCIDNVPGQQSEHSGYTTSQYQSLAWLAIQIEMDPQRIATHKEVELAQHRPHTDPRSFDWQQFWHQYEIWQRTMEGRLDAASAHPLHWKLRSKTQ